VGVICDYLALSPRVYSTKCKPHVRYARWWSRGADS